MNRLTTAWVSAYEGPRLSEDHWRDPVFPVWDKNTKSRVSLREGVTGSPR